MKKQTLLFLGLALPFAGWSQDNSTDAAVVKKVADYAVAHAAFRFKGDNNETWNSVKEIPAGATARISDHLSEWHYPNGVLNIAMTDLGEYLNDKKYTEFS